MKKFTTPHRQGREKVNAYFQSQSSFWRDIYTSDGVFAEIHRDRHAAILTWIDELALVPGSRVLEIGCGAGFMSIALAQRGFRVHAIDSVEAMVEQARRHAAESGIADLLSVDAGDVYALAFEDESFDLVLALGVIPWLEQPELAILEMARVTRPGGYVLLTADNRARLTVLLDPMRNPVFAPLRHAMKFMLARFGLHRRAPDITESVLHDCSFIDKVVANAELVKIRGMTLGFGPFSLFRHKVLPESFATTLHHRLQRLADRGVPGLRSTGAQYLILVSKPASRSLLDSRDTGESVSDIADVL